MSAVAVHSAPARSSQLPVRRLADRQMAVMLATACLRVTRKSVADWIDEWATARASLQAKPGTLALLLRQEFSEAAMARFARTYGYWPGDFVAVMTRVEGEGQVRERLVWKLNPAVWGGDGLRVSGFEFLVQPRGDAEAETDGTDGTGMKKGAGREVGAVAENEQLTANS